MNNGGDGTINSPVSFPPPNQNCNLLFLFIFFCVGIIGQLTCFCFSDYTSLQLFLSCGQEVTMYAKLVGYSDNGLPVSGLPVSNDFRVDSWTNNVEDKFFEAQVFMIKTK